MNKKIFSQSCKYHSFRKKVLLMQFYGTKKQLIPCCMYKISETTGQINVIAFYSYASHCQSFGVKFLDPCISRLTSFMPFVYLLAVYQLESFISVRNMLKYIRNLSCRKLLLRIRNKI